MALLPTERPEGMYLLKRNVMIEYNIKSESVEKHEILPTKMETNL